MKIKELAKKLKITEKTIRYYEEQGFLHPKLEEKNGRNFREYTEEDQINMEAIVRLRKLSFTVQEIHAIYNTPEKMAQICAKHTEELQRQLEYDRYLLRVLEQVHISDHDQVKQLSAKLAEADRKVRKENLDLTPLFHRLDQEYDDLEFQKWERAQEKRRWSQDVIWGMLNSRQLQSTTSGYMNRPY